MTHEIDVIYNNGWEDAPAWKVICECGWECWDCTTREVADTSHAQHAIEHGYVRKERVRL